MIKTSDLQSIAAAMGIQVVMTGTVNAGLGVYDVDKNVVFEPHKNDDQAFQVIEWLLGKGHFIRLSECGAEYYSYEMDEMDESLYGALDSLKENLISIALQVIEADHEK